MYECISGCFSCMHVQCAGSAGGGQVRMSEPLEPELQMIVHCQVGVKESNLKPLEEPLESYLINYHSSPSFSLFKKL